MKKAVSIKKLIICLGVSLAVGTVTSFLILSDIPVWYNALSKPFFNPSRSLFGTVWAILYLVMGLSLYMVWRLRVSRERNMALVAFLAQLLLNIGWSLLFFSFNMMGLALIEIIALWTSIILMMIIFYKIKPAASYVNVPYFCWVTFVLILNVAYLSLN